MSVLAQLQRVRDLYSVDPGLLALLSVSGEAVRVPGDTALLSEGRVNHLCFMLVEGGVALRLLRDEHAHHLRAVEPGEFFGHDAVLCREPHRWSARTDGPVTLLRFDSGTLEATLERGGPLATLLLERLAVSSARQLRDADALLMRCDTEPPRAHDDVDGYVRRVSSRVGIDPEAMEVRVQAVTDIGAGWKRR